MTDHLTSCTRPTPSSVGLSPPHRGWCSHRVTHQIKTYKNMRVWADYDMIDHLLTILPRVQRTKDGYKKKKQHVRTPLLDILGASNGPSLPATSSA